MGSSHLSCCLWLLATQKIPFTGRLGSPRCRTASSWYNDYFSCWLSPNTTFGNILLDLLLHTQKALFSFASLSLIPSNTWKYLSVDTFCMQVCKTALHFQQCSHQILGGIKTGAGLPRLTERCPLLGQTQGRGGRQAAPEGSGGPVFLHSSPRTHSAKRAGAAEGKHPHHLQAAPQHFAEPFDPKHWVLAIASLGSDTGAHICPPRRFLFLFLSKAPVALLPLAFMQLSAGHCICASFLCPFHLASAWLVDSTFHRQPGHHLCWRHHCCFSLSSAYARGDRDKKYCTDHLGNPSGGIRLLSIAGLLAL